MPNYASLSPPRVGRVVTAVGEVGDSTIELNRTLLFL